MTVVSVVSAVCFFFFSSRRRHTICALVTGVQTCALPICLQPREVIVEARIIVQPSADAGELEIEGVEHVGGREGIVDEPVAVGERGVVIIEMAPDLARYPRPERPSGLAEPTDIEVEEERSEEHTSELQSLMRISYAVFCLKKKKIKT